MIIWQYLENIICYDESIETVQKQKQILELYQEHQKRQFRSGTSQIRRPTCRRHQRNIK
jgi:hypothetical protein